MKILDASLDVLKEVLVGRTITNIRTVTVGGFWWFEIELRNGDAKEWVRLAFSEYGSIGVAGTRKIRAKG